jgi:dTDP-4-dehydrorhamnose reductase
MQKPGKTLVIGSESFLGKAFAQAYRKIYPDTIATHYRSEDPANRIDLCAPDLLPLGLRKGDYSYALVAAANANLALCEKEKGLAYRRNVEGVLHLVELLVELEIQPILFSTAYVFDGIEGNYSETSATNPINEYGRQKEALEKRIGRLCGSNYLIIRCSKVFDLIKGDNSLFDQICTPLIRGEVVRAAFDQVFCPIWIEDLVQAVFALQIRGHRGLYNLSGREIWTRLELTREIGKVLEIPASQILPISLDEVKSPFQMPKRTNMCCEKFHRSVPFRETPLSFWIRQLHKIYISEVRS